jgi:hypothetical protein
LGGRGILKGEITNAGSISQYEEQMDILAIEKTAFIVVQVDIEN